MSTLRNPKQEKFAQLVASGMTAQAAFKQAGYASPQNAPRLRSNALVSKRIEELQIRNERKAEMAALSRDELIGILAEVVHAARARLSEARLGDGLKAAEMLAKMCGWNEPERLNVQSVEVKVDAALIEQLRAGYAQLSERSAKECLPLSVGAMSAGSAQQEATPHKRRSQGLGGGEYAFSEQVGSLGIHDEEVHDRVVDLNSENRVSSRHRALLPTRSR